MKLRKKLLIAFCIITVLVTAATIYLNNVFLPKKLKNLIVKSIADATGKNVTLESVRFNMLKGLVLRNLSICDDKETLLSLKEGSCSFLILPIFRKTIILPAITLRSPVIFIQRRKDNTLNLQDIIANLVRFGSQQQGSKFNILAYKVNILNGIIRFQDDTFAQPFVKTMEGVDITVYLSLPAKVKFRLKSHIPGNPTLKISALGLYQITNRELIAKVALKDMSPQEFRPYYQDSGMAFPQGLIDIDALIDLKLKENIAAAKLQLEAKKLQIIKNKTDFTLNTVLKSDIQYYLQTKQFDAVGSAQLSDCVYRGLELIGPITAISGEVNFNKSNLSSENLTAVVWNVPVQVKAKLSDFSNLLFEARITSDPGLALVQRLAKEKFKFAFPGELSGGGKITVDIQNKAPVAGTVTFSAALDISGAKALLEKISSPVSDINGRIEFIENQISWPRLSFKYKDAAYKTKGTVTDLKKPAVRLELTSDELSLQSNLVIQDKIITLSKLDGRYYDCDFTLAGMVDIGNQQGSVVDLKGGLMCDLQNIGKIFPKLKAALANVNPQGKVRGVFDLDGKIDDIKSCNIHAEFSSPQVKFYNLKGEDFTLNLNQSAGVIDIPLLHLSLYEGFIDGSAKLDLNSKDMPVSLDATFEDIKIDKLKMDTPAKDKDISGILNAQLALKGIPGDTSKLSGAGRIVISEGKLWELNLFKGIGSFLLVKDFSKIAFNEGSCDFFIRDNFISTDNLRLKSEIADINGSAKIGFDNSVDANLEVQINDEMVPLTGTMKDVTTAIVGEAKRFGVILITGTLQEPKFKFKAAVGDILKGLRDTIFGGTSKNR